MRKCVCIEEQGREQKETARKVVFILKLLCWLTVNAGGCGLALFYRAALGGLARRVSTAVVGGIKKWYQRGGGSLESSRWALPSELLGVFRGVELGLLES